MDNNDDLTLDFMFFNVVKFDCAHINYTESRSMKMKLFDYMAFNKSF